MMPRGFLSCILAFANLAQSILTKFENGVRITCNSDKTIDVAIEFDVADSQILSLQYGNCNETMVKELEQNTEHGFNFTLDSIACGMTGLRSFIEIAQDLEVVVGKKDQGFDLVLAEFKVESSCQLKAEYSIDFNYQNVSAQTHKFSESGGITELEFDFAAYDENWSKLSQSDEPWVAGDLVHIGVKIATPSFDYSKNSFSIKKCTVTDSYDADITYTLFDAEAGPCNEDYLSLTVDYDTTTNMWKIVHILFLLNSYDASEYRLTCNVLICDNRDDAECKKLDQNCNKPSTSNTTIAKVDGSILWGNYSECSKPCGGGEKTRNGVCTPPVGGGAPCGPLSQTKACNEDICPIDGYVAVVSVGDCSASCGAGFQVKYGQCVPPVGGGAPCGPVNETVSCNLGNCPIDASIQWGSYSSCSKTCGPGVKSRSGTCTPEQFGGEPCGGLCDDVTNACTESTICNIENCPNYCKADDWLIKTIKVNPDIPRECEAFLNVWDDFSWNQGYSKNVACGTRFEDLQAMAGTFGNLRVFKANGDEFDATNRLLNNLCPNACRKLANYGSCIAI